MEALGLGLQAIGSAIGAALSLWAIAACCAICCGTFLIYTEKTTLEEIKEFIRGIRKNKW